MKVSPEPDIRTESSSTATPPVRSLWQDLFPDLTFTIRGMKDAVWGSTAGRLLAVLVIAGLALRLWHIGEVSLWLDETLTIVHSSPSLSDILFNSFHDDNPAVFYGIEHMILQVGSSETLLRLVPAILGVCTIPVFYILGKEVYNRETGILAATLLTFSSFHIYYSQDARAYTLFLFCFSVSLFVYLRALRTGSSRLWIMFGILTAFSCWTHLFGMVMAVPLFAFAVVSPFLPGNRGLAGLRPVIIAAAVTLLLVLPMFLSLAYASSVKLSSEATWGSQGTALVQSTFSDEVGGLTWTGILPSALFFIGMAMLLYKKRSTFLLFAAALLIPTVIAVELSFRMPITNRYLIGLLPFFILGIAYGIASFPSRFRGVRVSCIAIIVLILISIPPLAHYYSADSKYGQDWKGFAPVVQERAGPGTQILTYPSYYAVPLSHYYNNTTAGTTVIGISTSADLDGYCVHDPGTAKLLVTRDINKDNSPDDVSRWVALNTQKIGVRERLALYNITCPA